jgi:hypothetical protein
MVATRRVSGHQVFDDLLSCSREEGQCRSMPRRDAIVVFEVFPRDGDDESIELPRGAGLEGGAADRETPGAISQRFFSINSASAPRCTIE